MKKVLFLLLGFLFLSCNGQWAARKLLLSQGTQYELIKYGYLYNGYCVLDSRKLFSSDDWRLAIYTSEITDLIQSINPSETILSNTVGGNLKSTGFTYWSSPNTSATNATGFNGRGAGIRDASGVFSLLNQTEYIQVNQTGLSGAYRMISLGYNSNSLSQSVTSNLKPGTSIRPRKNTTTLIHGQTGTYTGNDWKIYRTICIYGVEWLADNLAETKYRNGDAIPEVTDNAAWAALTTGARCVYGNDENNR